MPDSSASLSNVHLRARRSRLMRAFARSLTCWLYVVSISSMRPLWRRTTSIRALTADPNIVT